MTSDREYAEQFLRERGIVSAQEALARRLLAALEREEKLREELRKYRAKVAELAQNALAPKHPEWYGNFADTQDTNPENGC